MRVLRVEEVAEVLGQHVKTVRRHIQEGRLAAVKIGGEWRVREEDLGAFLDGRRDRLRAQLAADVAAFVRGDGPAPGRGPAAGEDLQACVVVDLRAGDAERATALQRVFLDAMNTDDPARGPARFQALQDTAEPYARYVLWGRPAFLARVLARVEEVAGGLG